jgi:hypothetical protein
LRFGLIGSPNQHNRRPNQNKTTTPKKNQKEEARRAFRIRAGRKDQGRRREFQTGGFSGISSHR